MWLLRPAAVGSMSCPLTRRVGEPRNRLAWASSSLSMLIRMMEDGSSCEDVLTQLAAVNKALSRAGYAIVATGLKHCLEDGGGVDGVDAKKMEKLFLALAWATALAMRRAPSVTA